MAAHVSLEGGANRYMLGKCRGAVRALILLTLLLSVCATVVGQSSSSAQQDDCGTGSDATSDLDTAPVLTLPVLCNGHTENPDSSDAYRFYVHKGDELRIMLSSEEGGLDACVYSPESYSRNEPVTCANFWNYSEGQFGLLPYEEVATESGMWYVFIQNLRGDGVRHYNLSLTMRHEVFTGTILVGTEGPLVLGERTSLINSQLGPASPTIDGAWIPLSNTTGNESVRLRQSSPTPIISVTLSFYDENEELLEQPKCLKPKWDMTCPVPVGAAYALVWASGSVLQNYQLDYYY